MRFARVTGLVGGGLAGAADFVSAVEEATEAMERGPTRRAEGGAVVIVSHATASREGLRDGGRPGRGTERGKPGRRMAGDEVIAAGDTWHKPKSGLWRVSSAVEARGLSEAFFRPCSR